VASAERETSSGTILIAGVIDARRRSSGRWRRAPGVQHISWENGDKTFSPEKIAFFVDNT
jgi:hypothetical protein